MKFRETVQEDLDYAIEHSVSRSFIKHCPEQIIYCYTLEHNGNPLCVGGFLLVSKTTAWCWVDITSNDHKLRIYRTIKEWIDIFCKDKNIQRLQAYVECDFKKAIRMVKHLGFEYESTMERFIDGKDAYMYRRLI